MAEARLCYYVEELPLYFAREPVGKVENFYLSGVVSLTEMNGSVGKGFIQRPMTIYLLGDVHSIKGECPQLLDPETGLYKERQDNYLRPHVFIQELMDFATEIERSLDVFVEIFPFIESFDKFSPQITMEEFRALYTDIFSNPELGSLVPVARLVADLPERKNIRLHWTDPRSLAGVDYYLQQLEIGNVYESVFVLVLEISGQKRRRIDLDSVKKYLERFLTADSKILKQFLDNPLLDYADLSGLLSTIIDIEYETENTFGMLPEIDKILDLLSTSPTGEVMVSPRLQIAETGLMIASAEGKLEYFIPQSTLELFIIDVFVPLMDIYLLGRLFKRFQEPEQFPFTDRPNIVTTALIYAGDYHIQVYIEFLRRLGFEIVYPILTS
jgi:hypothetical protein